MSGFHAGDARKRRNYASKAFSAGESKAPQKERKELLVRAVARGWQAEVQGAWTLRQSKQGRG